ncbi:DNA (cytosine-5-)-methyltransferase [Rhizobium leguminosarum]|uniref:DNA cytosine methyltransferase n=1 Tax=Rhizobium leguminosarum TaxID=384 RepID=UPI003F9A8A31
MNLVANHASAKLSSLDLLIAGSIPPGGNWKDVPETVPSQRLAQIRISAAAGEGSRSTYYGRLHPDRPGYTINTYYNRPGNGCFLHYDYEGKQHRTISHREAARLQSFPDSFVFNGAQRSICQQIGNAVPPVLAYQIARSLGDAGSMIDIFAGAGGLSLGFKWSGWESLSATDFDKSAIECFNRNVSPVGFVGDMNDESIHDRLLAAAVNRPVGNRLALIGGPPCQGFSTGGNRRSKEDTRNHLHARYQQLLARLKPDVFVFENVLGLLSMDGGSFVKHVTDGLRSVGYDIALHRFNAARYGIPQRRERVVIIGVPSGRELPSPPVQWTQPTTSDSNFPVVSSVSEALSDLPKIKPGEIGSEIAYRSQATTPYQRLMRGELSVERYIVGRKP